MNYAKKMRSINSFFNLNYPENKILYLQHLSIHIIFQYGKNFDQEYFIMSIENAKMYLEAELRKKIS